MTKKWILLKDLPIEKRGTIIIVKDGNYVDEATGVSFPYSPVCNFKWFKEIDDLAEKIQAYMDAPQFVFPSLKDGDNNFRTLDGSKIVLAPWYSKYVVDFDELADVEKEYIMGWYSQYAEKLRKPLVELLKLQ